MKRSMAMSLMTFAVALTFWMNATNAAPPQGEVAAVQSSMPVLVCPMLVDLMWHWDQLVEKDSLNKPCTPVTWFPSSRPAAAHENLTPVPCSAGVNPHDFCRHEGVQTGSTYYYSLFVSYSCPDGVWRKVEWFDDTKVSVSESCTGNVHHNLALTGVTLVNPSLAVETGADLSLTDCRVEGGSLAASGGRLVIGDSVLDNAIMDLSSAQDNKIENSLIKGRIYETAIYIEDQARVSIEGNELQTGGIRVDDTPQVRIYNNTFRNGSVELFTTSGLPADRILIENNTFYDARQSAAVWQYGGSAKIVGNRFIGSLAGYDRPDAIILSDAVTQDPGPAVAYIAGNTITNYNRAISLGEESDVVIENNLFRGNDQGIRANYDAKAVINLNTLWGNESGLYALREPHLTLRDNCIAQNTDYGAEVTDPAVIFDARWNWWGHASGPEHPLNPGGQGDRASEPVNIANWLVSAEDCLVDTGAGVMGAAGGTVTSGSGLTALTVPSGALTGDTHVTVRIQDPSSMASLPVPPAGQAVLRLVNVTAEKASDGAPVVGLSEAGQLRVEYTEQEAVRWDEGTLGVYALGPGSSTTLGVPQQAVDTWLPLPNETDLESNVLTATVTSLGTFAAIGESTLIRAYVPLATR